MPYKAKVKKRRASGRIKLFLILSIVVTSLLLLGLLGWFGWQWYEEKKAFEALALELATPRIVVPEGHFTPKAKPEVHVSENIRGGKLVPGVDFYTDIGADKETVSAELDALLEKMEQLGMKTIQLDTRRPSDASEDEGLVVYPSQVLRSTDVDVLKLACEKARAAELELQLIFHAQGVLAAGEADPEDTRSAVDAEGRVRMEAAVSELTTYPVSAILIDGYETPDGGLSYKQYQASGSADSYTEWLREAVSATVSGLTEAVKTQRPELPVGLKVSSVWANASSEVPEEEDPAPEEGEEGSGPEEGEEAGTADEEGTPEPEGVKGGSETSSSHEALLDGHADTKAMAENKMVDFINVDIPSAIENPSVSFEKAVQWWGTVCKSSGLPLYVTHSGENANRADLAGWAGIDELARQVALSQKAGGYRGSVFTGISAMASEKKGSTQTLLKYYANEYDENELFQNLTVSAPTQTSFVTYEENVQFRGSFDPNQEVYLNGEKITPSERGGFSIWVPLQIGSNTIVLEHKGKTKTYTVERKIIIFQSVSPTQDMKVAGGSIIGLNAVAYKDSVLTASINGQTISMKEGGGDDNPLDSNYVNYTGEYVVPKATNKEQDIGRITFSGTYQGHTQGAAGANITIDKLPDEVDPDEATGQVLTHAVVTSIYADTYPYKSSPEYPDGLLYQLPEGTQDIVVSQTGNYLNLRSGKTVRTDKVRTEEIEFPGNNRITQVDYAVENNNTVIRLSMAWKAPFSLSLSPYPSSTGGLGSGYQFNADTVTLLFDYATTLGEGAVSGSLDGSPIFSGTPSLERIRNEELGIYQYKMVLPLNRPGRYYGCYASWEGDMLVLKFTHPPQGGDLSGLKICVDPGHGGSDVGTMAGADVLEKEVNLSQAIKVAQALRERGADVFLLRDSDETIDVKVRPQLAQQAGADLYISVHHNSAGADSTPNGVQTYYNTPFSQPLAQYVQSELEGVHPGGWNAWKYYNFHVAREKQFPSILIECGFLSNPGDEALAMDESHQYSMAEAIARGVVNYYQAYN